MIGASVRAFRSGLVTSLRLRVLMLTIAAFVVVAIPATLSFIYIVNSTVLKLGTLFAEKQILYDRYRGLEMLTREVGLAETLTQSPAVIEWAEDEASPSKRARGLAELERYRRTFRDQSYFFVNDASGNYYFNDRDDSFAGNQLRYQIQRENPRDGWYFKTIAGPPGCQLNVDHDDNLRVTKVWINCIVEHGGKRLGMIGSGIDLSTFIQEVVNIDQPGIQSLFVDANGAIQASSDKSEIDFHSLTKSAANRKTIYQMVDNEAGRATLAKMFADVTGDGSTVSAKFIDVGGHSTLIGVGYLDSLGWYNVTLMDVGEIIDRRLFLPIAGLLAAMMVAAAVLVTWLFKRSVLDRLARMEESVNRIEAGDYANVAADGSPDEIGRLSRALDIMARAVRHNTSTLEEAVRERTRRLEQIASIDELTGVANRRGFVESFERKRSAGARRLGLLLLDIDRFKTVNDRFGHKAGDEIVIEAARRLTETVGDRGICARWGGDEFVVLIEDCDQACLEATAQAVLEAVRTKPFAYSADRKVRLTTSIGAHLIGIDETLELAAGRADIALYAAKNSGRNRMDLFDPQRHGTTSTGFKVA